MISRVRLKKFKQFSDSSIDLTPSGVTLVAGGNNAGKSSLLHGLAVWEFCRTVVTMEKGDAAIRAGSNHQGLGLGDDEFSPIAVPSLKHLWTNLKTQRTDGDPDGYTLRIACEWLDDQGEEKVLEFGLSLSNDRLFARATASNLKAHDRVPQIAYLPPFAGITDREAKVTKAVRTRRIGEGLAGAVLRNILLEMQMANQAERTRLRVGRSKISDSALRELRDSNPWELLQQALRTQFSAELIVEPFREEYHSYIRVDLDKGVRDGYKLLRHQGYNRRDLMVEGSGFLQWLSVYALAASGDVDVLLLDEPDAHLHPTLQTQLLGEVRALAEKTGKQVLIATHSSEILKNALPTDILEVRQGGAHQRYLSDDAQKVGLLSGLGSSYAPKIDSLHRTKKLFFYEGPSDLSILEAVSLALGITLPKNVTYWQTPSSHKERRLLFRALQSEIQDIAALSLRDRDDSPYSTSASNLEDRSETSDATFSALKWRRRHIETYLIHPESIARVAGVTSDEIREWLAREYGLAIAAQFIDSDCPAAYYDAQGKGILKDAIREFGLKKTNVPLDIAGSILPAEIPADLTTMVHTLVTFAQP